MKQYLGDGVYIDKDEVGFLLTTENGYETTNQIYLDNEVFEMLLIYLNTMNDRESEK